MQRIQRKRVKGFRMPSNAIYIGRGRGKYGQWGNPYGVKDYGLTIALARYEEWLDKKLVENPDYLVPLLGKDLACWCSLDQPCHGDILLRRIRELYIQKNL